MDLLGAAPARGRCVIIAVSDDERRETSVLQLYPAIEPYRVGRLGVSDRHELHFEESGRPDGTPVVFVHGGPGAGTSAVQRRFFDPASYRIVLFDQRGCGRSTPHASIDENTTWDLVEDMERLRQHLGIDRWVVFGGSWGSTLALAYAERHPERVRAIVLRGIFLLRPHEIRWFYQEGASFVYPDAWEAYLAPIPPDERGKALGLNMVAALSGQFIGLLIGGILAVYNWRYVFLISVPFGVIGTIWAFMKLKELVISTAFQEKVQLLPDCTCRQLTAIAQCVLSAAGYLRNQLIHFSKVLAIM